MEKALNPQRLNDVADIAPLHSSASLLMRVAFAITRDMSHFGSEVEFRRIALRNHEVTSRM